MRQCLLNHFAKPMDSTKEKQKRLFKKQKSTPQMLLAHWNLPDSSRLSGETERSISKDFPESLVDNSILIRCRIFNATFKRKGKKMPSASLYWH